MADRSGDRAAAARTTWKDPERTQTIPTRRITPHVT